MDLSYSFLSCVFHCIWESFSFPQLVNTWLNAFSYFLSLLFVTSNLIHNSQTPDSGLSPESQELTLSKLLGANWIGKLTKKWDWEYKSFLQLYWTPARVARLIICPKTHRLLDFTTKSHTLLRIQWKELSSEPRCLPHTPYPWQFRREKALEDELRLIKTFHFRFFHCISHYWELPLAWRRRETVDR